jgi:hypothetical protein
MKIEDRIVDKVVERMKERRQKENPKLPITDYDLDCIIYSSREAIKITLEEIKKIIENLPNENVLYDKETYEAIKTDIPEPKSKEEMRKFMIASVLENVKIILEQKLVEI